MSDLTTNILIKVINAFTAPLKKLDDDLKNVEKTSERVEKKMKFAADLNQAAEAMGRFNKMLIGPLQSSVQEFASFEQSMSNVSALSDQMKGSEGFEKLKTQALELGAATAYSSQEAADAMAVYAQAGRKVNEILQLTPMTLATAKANNLGLAETAAIVNHTMKQMQIDTSQAGHVMDVLTASAAASDMTLQDMGTAMAYVGPVANQAGMSLELTAAMLGKMKDAGLEASSVGVGMRAVLTRLLDPSKEATRALNKLGFSQKQITELQKKVAGGKVDEALRAIGAAADKLPNEQRMKLMSQIFGMEAQTAATIAIQASSDIGVDGVRAAEAAYKKADGTAQRLSGVMGDNLNGSIERASGAISGLETAVGEALAPHVAGAAEIVESLAGGLQEFVKEYPLLTGATGKFMAMIIGLTAVLQGGLLAVSAYTSATALLQKQYALMRGSIMGNIGLVAAVGMAAYAIGTWANDTFELHEKFLAMIGMKKGGDEGEAGKGRNKDKVTYAHGWELDERTGEVTKFGDLDKAPKQVKGAIKKGAKTQAEISAVLAAPINASIRQPMMSRVRDAALMNSPLADASKTENAAARAEAATKEQTTLLLETLRKQQAAQERTAEAIEARNREFAFTTGAPYGVPY